MCELDSINYVEMIEKRVFEAFEKQGYFPPDMSSCNRDKLKCEYSEWTHEEVYNFCVSILLQKRAVITSERNIHMIKTDDKELDLTKVWKNMKTSRPLIEISDMFHRVLLSLCGGNMKILRKIYATRDQVVAELRTSSGS